MRGMKLWATIGLAMAVSQAAFAVMSVPDGWYLEGNAGSSSLSKKHYPGSASSSGIGGNANLGYKLMQYLGIEIGYSQYSNTRIQAPNGTRAATDKHYSYDLALKGILPIVDSGFEAFAKIGPERISSSVSINNQTAANSIGIARSSHSTSGLYIGAGGQYYVMPELAIVVQWQRAQGNSSTGTENLFSGGLSFIFD